MKLLPNMTKYFSHYDQFLEINNKGKNINTYDIDIDFEDKLNIQLKIIYQIKLVTWNYMEIKNENI